MKYAFIKARTANKITLAKGFRFVKGTAGKYTVMKKDVVVAGFSCKCKDVGVGSCSFGVKNGVGSCTQGSRCQKGCSMVVEQY